MEVAGAAGDARNLEFVDLDAVINRVAAINPSPQTGDRTFDLGKTARRSCKLSTGYIKFFDEGLRSFRRILSDKVGYLDEIIPGARRNDSRISAQ